jgi:hypothetical protein
MGWPRVHTLVICQESSIIMRTHVNCGLLLELNNIFYLQRTDCLYCNGDYDDTIEQELEVSTGRATTKASTWTGERDARLDEPEQD